MPEDHQYLFHFLLSSLQLRLVCQQLLVRLPVIFRMIKPVHCEACLHQRQQQPFSFPFLSFEKGQLHLK